MKKLHKKVTIVLTMIMVMSCMFASTAMAVDEQKNFTTEVENNSIIEMEETTAATPRLTSLFSYQSDNFYIENNQGAFKSNVTSNDARVVVAAIRADGVKDGTITVDVYKKNLIGKTRVQRYTCDADGKAHTSGSFAVSKNANYVVDIYTSTSLKSVVSVTIAAA